MTRARGTAEQWKLWNLIAMKKQTHALDDRGRQTASDYKNTHTPHPPRLLTALHPSQEHLHIQQHLSLDHGSGILSSFQIFVFTSQTRLHFLEQFPHMERLHLQRPWQWYCIH